MEKEEKKKKSSTPKEDEKREKVEEKVNEKKKRKGLIILLLLVVAFLLFFFLYKFKVTFKYNNGEPNYVVGVKFLRKIPDKEVRKDLTSPGLNFVGYFETYYLSGSEIAKVREDASLRESICKNDFKLNQENDKCVAISPFDFEHKRIVWNKTIEALWSNVDFNIDPKEKTIYVDDGFTITATVTGSDDKTVTWSSKDSGVATVDENGNVKGIKEGKVTITATSNGITRECNVTVEKRPENPPKDEGTVSLSANDQCMVGTSSVTARAVVNNALDGTINWTYPRCFAHEIYSDNSVKLYRNTMCNDSEELNPVLGARLNNGASDSLTFTYEPKLTFTVYNGGQVVSPSFNGTYEGNNMRIETNVPANFSGKYIASTTSNSVTMNSTCQSTITITTTCGQTQTVNIAAVIN